MCLVRSYLLYPMQLYVQVVSSTYCLRFLKSPTNRFVRSRGTEKKTDCTETKFKIVLLARAHAPKASNSSQNTVDIGNYRTE